MEKVVEREKGVTKIFVKMTSKLNLATVKLETPPSLHQQTQEYLEGAKLKGERVFLENKD
jgi:hypothetical protein